MTMNSSQVDRRDEEMETVELEDLYSGTIRKQELCDSYRERQRYLSDTGRLPGACKKCPGIGCYLKIQRREDQ